MAIKNLYKLKNFVDRTLNPLVFNSVWIISELCFEQEVLADNLDYDTNSSRIKANVECADQVCNPCLSTSYELLARTELEKML